MAFSSGSVALWECTFQLGGQSPAFQLLSSNLEKWRGGPGIQQLGQALLLSVDMVHYVGCRDDDLVLKLKWHTIVVRFTSTQAFGQWLFIHFLLSILLIFIVFLL